MKSTGIVRQVDPLGRIVIPMELRRVMGIEEKDSLEIYTESDRIILRKYQPNCQCRLCGGTEDRMLQTEYGPVCITCAKTVIAAVGGKAADR